ncbi:Cystine/glutamate transporter [Varanus komodoensis]|nr:Cystine/glutamate transporter [Varanus komodoensis]
MRMASVCAVIRCMAAGDAVCSCKRRTVASLLFNDTPSKAHSAPSPDINVSKYFVAPVARALRKLLTSPGHQLEHLCIIQLKLPLIYLMVSIGDLYGLLNFYSFSRWFFLGLATLGLILQRYRHPEMPRPFKVPLFIPLVFTIACFFIVGTSLYADPVNTGIGCAITLTGLPVYYLVVQKTRLPRCCTSKFNSLTVKLQILMKVAVQEVQTY